MKIKNIFNFKLIKLINIILIMTIILYSIINYINKSQVYAMDRESYSNRIDNYPGYTELINNLKASHPNWNFTILYTGLDWNQVIKNESILAHRRNLVPTSKPSSWVCPICGDKTYDNGSWKCASEAAVSYYMDPRNGLNEDYVFQFESLSFNGDIQNEDGVNQILSDVYYMQGDTITYTTTSGTDDVINKSYAQVIMEAAEEAGISPYHLAARIRQEQGAGSRPSATASGTYSGYIGCYNFLNIKATGSGSAQIIANALTYARNNGLTNPEASIKAGAKVLASDYINDGQDTLYLQKFDVEDSDGTLYYFQYMQNAAAAKNEGFSVMKTYSNLGMIDSSIDFIVPVFENMPDTACPEPGTEEAVTENIRIKGTDVNVRSGPSRNSSIIGTVNTGDELLRIEIASTSYEGYYWDKIVLPDGTKGYVARNFIIGVNDITNCNDKVIANTSVNLRNGPGISGTTVVTTLIKGQLLTRIETNKYNVDGYIWDRVVLSDGRQGYVAQNYIDIAGDGNNNSNTGEIIKVICASGLKVRQNPGTNYTVVKILKPNETLTRTEAGVSDVEGYTWDKVVTDDGVEGYIARGDSTEQYIEVVSSNNNNNNNNDNNNNTNDQIKVENSQIICTPNTTAQNIKNVYSDAVIKKGSTTISNSENIGTGYTVTTNGKTYKITKIGDVSGDGTIDARDSLRVLKYSVGTYKLENEFAKAADINNDGTIDARDSLRVLKYSVGTFNITI